MRPTMEAHLKNVRSVGIGLGPGQYLFHIGDPINTVYLVQKGHVHLARHQSDGSLLVIQKAGPGAIVAEASTYSDQYHCDAIATTPARLLGFAKADFRDRLRRDPGAAEAWAAHLAHELQRARLHAEILSIKTVTKRLDVWMTWHSYAAPKKGGWKVVADEIGVSPEALYREVAKRRRQRVVLSGKDALPVQNP